MGRLLRWDRNGTIYTDEFDWAKNPHLFDFFWRLNFLSEADRGYDPTVTAVKGDTDEAKAALLKLRMHKGLKDLKGDTFLWKIWVHDDLASQPRSYITPGAIWDTNTLFGRCTFGYIAYDVTEPKLVYLKDYWCTDLPRIQKEGVVYRKLRDADVPNIPVLGPAGDVLFDAKTQRTKTQDYLKVSRGNHRWCLGRPSVEPYVHYRLVLETVGQPLNTFSSTRELCQAIRDAIVGKEYLFAYHSFID